MPADNNYCENQIRPFAVGRRSWLFVGSQLGANASANLYSIVMTCRANEGSARRVTRWLIKHFILTSIRE
jgi:hypothetical protein